VIDMKIVAVMMVYNCGDILLPSLQDLDGKVDEIHCYDGRWGYGQTDYSIDNTKEVIEQFALTAKEKVEYHKLPPVDEAASRTLSIANIAEGDWVFVLGSDERILQWNDNIRAIEDAASYVYTNKVGDVLCVCRLFKKTKTIKYCLCDRVVEEGKGIYDLDYMVRNFKPSGIIIGHSLAFKPRLHPHASEFSRRPHP